MKAQVFERRHVERVGHRDDERRAPLHVDRERDVLLRQLLLHVLEHGFVDGELVEIDEREAELALQPVEHHVLGDQPELHERGTEQLAGAALFGDGRVEVLLGDELLFEQNIAQPFVVPGHP